MPIEIMTIINVLITAINIGVLGLCLKLYTEYFKDKSIGAKSAAMKGQQHDQ